MATKALFISVADLKKKSIIDGNVDSDKILQFVEVAQDTHIQNYLGGKLYEKIQELIVAGTIGDAGNEDYNTLLTTYIKPMLIWYAQAEYLPFSMFQAKNGGVYKHRSENSDVAEKEDVDYIVQKCRSNAEFYTQRFIDYMCENSSLYSEYLSNESPYMHPDKDTNYTGGFVL